MVILQIGNNFPQNIVRQISYISDDYLLDADLLIIDLGSILNEFYGYFKHQNQVYSIRETDLEHFVRKATDRKEELSQYLKNGHTLLVYNADLREESFTYVTAEGESFKRTLDFYDFINLNSKDFVIQKQAGRNITALVPPFSSFIESFETSYRFMFQKYKGTPICEIKNTHQVVALDISFESGNILLLPNMVTSSENWQLALINIYNYYLNKEPNHAMLNLPDWCSTFEIGDEKLEKEKMASLVEKSQTIEVLISKQQEIIDEYNNLKRVLTTTGNELESVVADILQKMGYEVLRPDGNRDDLIVKKGKEVAVIEVKGVKGSAAEKHAAQLMKWVNNYHIDNDINPKGILIVNSFKDLPISERVEESFPNQMLPYCVKMGFCLLSTKQLLKLYIKQRFDDLPFEDIHTKIFGCNGVLVVEEVTEVS